MFSDPMTDKRVGSGEVAHSAGLVGHETAGHLGAWRGRADLKAVPGVVNVGTRDAEYLARDRQFEDRCAGLDGHSHPMSGQPFTHYG